LRFAVMTDAFAELVKERWRHGCDSASAFKARLAWRERSMALKRAEERRRNYR
jgi:uncharacterized protein CbrC (UPF0167 family)